MKQIIPIKNPLVRITQPVMVDDEGDGLKQHCVSWRWSAALSWTWAAPGPCSGWSPGTRSDVHAALRPLNTTKHFSPFNYLNYYNYQNVILLDGQYPKMAVFLEFVFKINVHA